MSTEPSVPAPNFSAPPLRSLDITGIKKALPHRYPFLLIDRIDVIEEDKLCRGVKMVTSNEHFFEGHFPGQPVMPGVLIIESMAQTACAMLLSKGGYESKIAFFMGIDEAKFRTPVTPGCVLTHHITIIRLGRAGKFRGESYVDGKLVAEAMMTFALVDKAAA